LKKGESLRAIVGEAGAEGKECSTLAKTRRKTIQAGGFVSIFTGAAWGLSAGASGFSAVLRMRSFSSETVLSVLVMRM
jgi:hypothetical protein